MQFKRKDQLDSHEYTHSQKKKFICTEPGCGKSYVNNAHLQRHKRSAHSKLTTIFHCDIESCGSFFDSESKLKQHHRKQHVEKAVEFECEICCEKFRRKAQLQQHMFAHTGCYRYKCEKCDKGFLQLGHLKRHENTHRTHSCELCQATFDKWSSLVAHKQSEHVETANKCAKCDKVFRSKRGLKYHSQVHAQTDDRIVYQCTFDGCPKFFFHRNNMLAHFKSKHENKKFICAVGDCGRELSTKQKLEQHIKIVHADGDVNVKNTKTKSKPKVRAKRKDKGVPKKSTASKLFNVILPAEVEKAILSGNNDNISIEYNQDDRIQDEDEDEDFHTNPLHFNTSVTRTTTVEC